jgi:hypothetical protein
MAEFWVRHSLNLTKIAKFNITLRYVAEKSERGEHVWVLEIGTLTPDTNGDFIYAKKVHLMSANNLDEVIEDAVSELCARMDWSPFVEDKYAPNISNVVPTESGVSIANDIRFTLADELPSAGIDLSSVKVFLNNSMTEFNITSEVQVTGDPYQYEFKWSPGIRVYSRYN